jgi:hypothetical protein
MVSGLYANHALNTISQSHDCLLLTNSFWQKKTIACSQWSRVRAHVGAGPAMVERGRLRAHGSSPWGLAMGAAARNAVL